MKTVEDIIATSNYYDLTSEEREMVHELVENEAQFNEMKAFFSELSTLAPTFNTTPSSSVKTKLDEVFAAKHPSFEVAAKQSSPETKVVPLYKRTWMQIAALFLIVLSIAPFLNFKSDEVVQQEPTQFSQNTVEETQQDLTAEIIQDKGTKNATNIDQISSTKKKALVNDSKFTIPNDEIGVDKNIAAAPSASWGAGMDADLNPSGYSSENATEEISAAEMLELIQAAY